MPHSYHRPRLVHPGSQAKSPGNQSRRTCPIKLCTSFDKFLWQQVRLFSRPEDFRNWQVSVSTEDEIKVKVFRKEKITVQIFRNKRIKVSTNKEVKVSADDEVKVSTENGVKVNAFTKEGVNVISEFGLPRSEANQREIKLTL